MVVKHFCGRIEQNMKKYFLVLSVVLAYLFILFSFAPAASAQACPSGSDCGWINVADVYPYGVPPDGPPIYSCSGTITTSSQVCTGGGRGGGTGGVQCTTKQTDTPYNGPGSPGPNNTCTTDVSYVSGGGRAGPTYGQKTANNCTCQLTGYGEGPAENFYNDGPTVTHLCQVSGYDSGVAVQQKKWDNCNDEYYITWNGSDWSGRNCNARSWLWQIYCAKPANTPGCTDPTASNYNSAATVDDGSCSYPAPTISISANPDAASANFWTLFSGVPTTISWSSTDANSCSASGDWSGDKGTSGSETDSFNIPGQKTFTLTCTNSGGSTSQTAYFNLGWYDTPPSVTIATPANGSSFAANSTIAITAYASDLDPSITISKVEFYANGAKIGEANAAPYFISWPSVAIGTYTLTAVATDSNGGQSTSVPVVIAVGTGLTGVGTGTGTGTGSGSTGGSGGTNGFTMSAPAILPVRFLANEGATSALGTMTINPSGSFVSPVSVSLVSVSSNTTGTPLAPNIATVSFDGGSTFVSSPVATLSYNSSLSQYMNPNGTIGIPFEVKFVSPIAEPYDFLFKATGGGVTVFQTVTVNPNVINPIFKEI